MAKELDDVDLTVEIDENENDDEGYQIYDIATYPSDLTLDGINKMWIESDILIPEWQRGFVWNIKQSSKMIESFLLGLPVPPVFFYINQESKSEVIDGQQRILTAVYYFSGFFGEENNQGEKTVFRLKGLNPKSKFANKAFSELDDSDKRKLKNSVLRAINVRQLKPDDDNTSVYHIFERLNTGGTPLKPQEIRNCVYRGSIRKKLSDLNADLNWRQILGNNSIEKHQKDVELILRILALSDSGFKYEKPIKDFLSRYMKKNLDFKNEHQLKFEKIFPKITAEIISSLGPKPFHIRGPLNTSALDAVFCTVIKNIDSFKYKNFKSNYGKLIKDDKFIETTLSGTSDESIIAERMRLAEEYLVHGK